MAQRIQRQNGYVLPTGKSPRTWTGFWYEYVTSAGITKRKKHCRVLGKRADLTKGDAEAALRELIARRLRGESEDTNNAAPPVDPKCQLFQAAAERYLDLKRGDWGKKMYGNLASIFRSHIYPMLGQKMVGDIKASDIKAFFNSVAAAGSESLVKACVTYTRGVFEMLIDDDVLTRNPARQVPKPKKTRRVSKEFRTMEECARLLRAAESEPRDHLILLVFLSCALRPSELFALRLEDIEPGRLRIDEAFVPVDGLKETKTLESDGYVPMSANLEAELRNHVARSGITEPKEFLFPTEIGTATSHDNYLDRVLKPIGARAGIRVNFQILRRTVATHLQDHGQPKSAQALLRHAEVQTTLKHYQQTLDANVIAAAESWSAAIGKEVDELQRLLIQ
jgi:integrase